MARLILKSPYIKSTGGASGYLRYIATRERVELIPDDRPPTRKQEQLIAKLLKDFPDSKTLYEYEDYLTKPTTRRNTALHLRHRRPYRRTTRNQNGSLGSGQLHQICLVNAGCR